MYSICVNLYQSIINYFFHQRQHFYRLGAKFSWNVSVNHNSFILHQLETYNHYYNLHYSVLNTLNRLFKLIIYLTTMLGLFKTKRMLTVMAIPEMTSTKKQKGLLDY